VPLLSSSPQGLTGAKARTLASLRQLCGFAFLLSTSEIGLCYDRSLERRASCFARSWLAKSALLAVYRCLDLGTRVTATRAQSLLIASSSFGFHSK